MLNEWEEGMISLLTAGKSELQTVEA